MTGSDILTPRYPNILGVPNARFCFAHGGVVVSRWFALAELDS